MKKETTYPVSAPSTLLPFLLEHVEGQSRNSVKHLLSRGQILVDGHPQRQFDLPLSADQQVTILPRPAGPALPFPVLYEDAGLIVIQKPAGLLCVATDTQRTKTAYRMVSDHLKIRDPGSRLFVVHRLDRDTSGVLLFAKDQQLKRDLQNDWNHLVKKRAYWAIVEGNDLPASGVCRSRLTETKTHKVYSSKGQDGREAVTRFHTLSRRGETALLQVEIDTGRKNQIRAHLSELGHPVVGDEKYGATTDPLGRLGLHAHQLSLTDPRSGKTLTFSAPPPDGFCRMFPGQKW